MTSPSRYAFIVKHKSYSAQHQQATLETDEFKTVIVGVSNPQEALAIINSLISKGIQVVELCGGFTEPEKDHIKQELKHQIPLGIVKFDDKDLEMLESFANS